MITRLVAVILLLAGIGLAQPLPDAPSETKKQIYLAPLRSPTFWLSTAVFSAGAIADVHSTRECVRLHQCVEAYPGHDRYGYIAPQIALVAGMTYGCEIMLHYHKWWRRTVCPGIGIGLSIVHWKDSQTIYYQNPVAQP